MTGTRVARKYASALFGLAAKAGTEQAVWDELVVLRDIIRKDSRFLDFLAAPQIPDDDKHRITRSALAGLSQPVVQNFLLFLIDKRRSEFLEGIIEVYGQMLDESQGVVEARITSAVPLEEAEVRRIVERLERISGKTVRHALVVDPAILGGVVVVLGGEIIDHSVRQDLLRLRDELRAIKVHEAA